MSGKADFSADEWNLLRSSPLMASMLVVAASPSGPVGLVQESTATAKTIMQSVGTAQTPLLKALSEDVTQTMAIPKPPPGATPGQIQGCTLDRCQPRTSVRGSGFSNPREHFILQ